MINYQLVYSLNHGYGKNFDAFDANIDNLSFCLSDGANSALLSGEAATFTAKQLVSLKYLTENDVFDNYENIHQNLNERFPGSACTSAHVQVGNRKLLISYCGDTLIEVFKLTPPLFQLFGQFKWEPLWESQPDWIENTHSPSQLLGSQAYRRANIKQIETDDLIFILLSTDGLHQFVDKNLRLQQIMQLKNNQPSEHDLDYICHTLTNQALSNGSKDDISIAAIWLDLGKGNICE
jgi:hypothetical protein